MSLTLQVLYPITDSTTFGFEYYEGTHIPLVVKVIGPFAISASTSKRIAGGPRTPPGFHAGATMVFEDQAALDAAIAAVGPVIADIPNDYNAEPQMLIGSVVGWTEMGF